MNPQSEAELAAVRRSIVRSRPFGDDEWTLQTAKALGLERSMRVAGGGEVEPQGGRESIAVTVLADGKL